MDLGSLKLQSNNLSTQQMKNILSCLFKQKWVLVQERGGERKEIYYVWNLSIKKNTTIK